jgi:hypothetical protein
MMLTIGCSINSKRDFEQSRKVSIPTATDFFQSLPLAFAALAIPDLGALIFPADRTWFKHGVDCHIGAADTLAAPGGQFNGRVLIDPNLYDLNRHPTGVAI